MYLVGTAASSASSLAGAAIASIPSPSANSIDIGPFSLNFYGLCIGFGVLAGIYLAQKRWADRGGDPDDIYEVAKWAVPAGLIGARIYHIINDWRPWHEWHEIWNGGLGIGGGIVGGIAGAYFVAKRRGLNVPEFIDAAILCLPIGQAIGRFGNWFNQENFGTPTDLPWALRIDERYRPDGFVDAETFHPAFLYEAIWNVLLVIFMIRLDRRGVLKQGMMLPVYIVGYSIGRIWIEAIRIDPAPEYLGLRFNLWVYGVAAIIGLVWLLRFGGSKPSFYAEGGEGASRDERPDRGLVAPIGTKKGAKKGAGSATDGGDDE